MKRYALPDFPAADLIESGAFRPAKVNPDSIQTEVIDAFRFTDAFRDAYGNALLDRRPNSKTVAGAIAAYKRLCNPDIDITDIAPYRSVLADMLYSKKVLGFNYWEYFTYDMEHKTISERMEYLPEGARLYFYNKILKPNKKQRYALSQKFLTYQALKDEYNRAMCQIASEKNKPEFMAFLSEVGTHRFMIKPRNGSLGKGIRYVVCDGEHPAEAVFEAPLQEAPLVCEEEIISHEFFAKFHEPSLNCIRIHTAFNGKEVRHKFAWVKFGANGYHIATPSDGGGMDAPIDCETGIICGNAGDESAHRFTVHPNSGIRFEGQQIPDWQGCLDMTAACARKFPGVPVIGWDIALSKDKGWQIVEGNPQAMFTSFQFASNHPVLREFAETVQWIVDTREKKK